MKKSKLLERTASVLQFHGRIVRYFKCCFISCVCVMCPFVLWLVGGASFGDVAVLPFAQANHLTDGERMRKVRRYLAGCYEVLDAATITRNQIL